jgi:hypothetical protein
MTVRVVFDGPPRRPHVGRAFAVLFAFPLLLVGIVGAYGLTLCLVMAGSAVFGDTSFNSRDRRELALFAGACLAAALVGVVGLRLIRGKRRLVLFLRRFGFAQATRIVSFAVSSAMGRSWRLVTLDDDRVQAVGGRSGSRRLIGLLAFAGLAAGGWGLWWLVSGKYLGGSSTVSHPAGDQSVQSAFGNAIGAAIGAAIAAVIALAFALFITIVTGVSGLLAATAYGYARGSERAKRDRISTDRDIARHTHSIVKRSRRIFAPRLVVVAVANPIWQAVVQAFARSTSAMVVDISVPGDSLHWEISTLLPIYGRRCVFVGAADLVARPDANGQPVFVSPLANVLDGQVVLAYTGDKAGIKRFARALRATIEARQ